MTSAPTIPVAVGTIHLHHEILDAATDVEDLDVGRLEDDLTRGAVRRAVFDDAAVAATDAVAMSPHVFLPDGTDHPNPGISVRWSGEWAKGFPVITDDEPAIGEWLLRRALACS